MAKHKKEKKVRKNKSAGPVRKENSKTMAVTPAELQAKLDALLKDVTDAKPGVDSAVALIATLRTQLADAIKNSADLTEAAASVDKILAAHQANAKELVDGGE